MNSLNMLSTLYYLMMLLTLHTSTAFAYEAPYDEQNTSEYNALVDDLQIEEKEMLDDEQSYEENGGQEDDESDLELIDATDEESIPEEQIAIQAPTEMLPDELETPLIEQTDDVVESNSANDFMNVIYSFVVSIKNSIQSLFSPRM